MKKLLLVLVISLLAVAAFSQQIAVIDMATISKCEYVSQAYSELEALNAQYDAEVRIRQENQFLGENEITDLVNLVANKGDQAKIKEYQDNNTKRYDELQVLNQTKTLTDEQKTRLAELNNLTKKSRENLENRVKTFSDSLETLASQKAEEIQNNINAACEKIAKDKKYSVVIEKSAVFYGGIDITKDVIAALPKAK